jgi:hypothetical protein
MRRLLPPIGCGVSLALATLLAASPARADLLHGRISGGGFKGGRDTLFVLGPDSTAVDTVRSLANNTYKIVLDSGAYVLVFRDAHGTLWEDSLEVGDDPVRHDVVLHKRRAHP